ncbi:hypothetical protein AMEX_G9969 [Astyanax mexicanus]|uniref:Uncharacterized protein n=1 Tax=Astyanax mexicanus TaxID=7994 RepID=A0A8T2M393_ASTMX|nr:hypothetical protein AMEX_G9969 [Astyanax mexicanus]
MFRFTLLLCSSVLLYSCSASPFKSWRKDADPALQETKMSDEFDEKMTLGLKEVEPLELDLTNSDIDPNMLIWKAIKQLNRQKYEKPEEDKDQLYHPFEEPSNKQPDSYFQPQQFGQVQLYQEPEQDMDNLYHSNSEKQDAYEKSVQTGAEHRAEEFVYLTPEEDKDGLYHESFPSESIVVAPVMQAFDNEPKRVYTEPEEDLDNLYHS